MRVTQRGLFEQLARDVSGQLERLAALRRRVATGVRIERPQDDPLATGLILNLRANIQRLEARRAGLQAGQEWLEATQQALQRAGELAAEARNLALRGANGDLSADERSVLATEAEELLQRALDVGRSRALQGYLFAGFKTATDPFDYSAGPPSSVTYQGDAGVMQRPAGPVGSVAVNVSGTDLLPLLNELIGLRDELAANDVVALQSRMTSIDGVADDLGTLLGQVASRLDRARQADADMASLLLRLEEMRARHEEVDMAEALVELSAQEQGYLVALEAASRRAHLSLFDFLR